MTAPPWLAALLVVAASLSEPILHCAASPGTISGPVRLQARPDIHRGLVAALPSVLAGGEVSPAVAKRINAALRQEDESARVAYDDCQTNMRAGGVRPDPNAYTHTVELTMRGPRYLGFEVADEWDCGGAHPSTDLTPLTFDLTTGARVHWLALFPPDVRATAGDTTGASITWPLLVQRGLAEADEDCREVWENGAGTTFEVEVRAESGSLAFLPSFPHPVANCADPPVTLDAAALEQAKVSPVVVHALEAARKFQHEAPHR